MRPIPTALLAVTVCLSATSVLVPLQPLAAQAPACSNSARPRFLSLGCDGSVVVEGHTDSDGDTPSNLALSAARAISVRDALVEAGVAATSLSTRGLGESRPVASNETPEGRARNRRVDILIR